MRQDYIEPEYVNGVKDADGKMVIRPLNSEEKRFLNSFYEEVVSANFMHDSELKKLHKEMKPLKDIVKNGGTLTEDEVNQLDYLQIQYFARADEVLLYSDSDDQKKIYGENNARNRCLYNRSKAAGTLDELNNETFDLEDETDYVCSETGRNLSIDKHEHKRKTVLRKKKN